MSPKQKRRISAKSRRRWLRALKSFNDAAEFVLWQQHVRVVDRLYGHSAERSRVSELVRQYEKLFLDLRRRGR